jgi:Skp family chaperone for outer membrane proteins
MTTAFVMTAVLVAGPAMAQTQTPPKLPPAPAAQTPQAPAKPATPPPALVPFPDGAKMAFVNFAQVAAESIVGKAATAQINTLREKRLAEQQSKNVQLKALQDKQASGGALMSEVAKSQTTRDIDKLQGEIQFAQQTAQKEIDDLNTDLMNDFYAKVLPVVKAIAEEKGIDAVLSGQDAGALYTRPGLDISAEVIKRLDALGKGK